MAGSLSDDDLTPVAGGGLLHRRLLLKRGLVLAVATAAAPSVSRAEDTKVGATADPANPPWLHKTGLPFTGYGAPSKYEKYVVRNIGGNRTPAGDGVSWTPLEDLGPMSRSYAAPDSVIGGVISRICAGNYSGPIAQKNDPTWLTAMIFGEQWFTEKATQHNPAVRRKRRR